MKTSRKIQSVYRNQNALIRAVFERAGDAPKVLCVALDYAKRKHVALICDGNGDVLKASFPVENNAAGIAHLIKEISATARHRKIPKRPDLPRWRRRGRLRRQLHRSPPCQGLPRR